ncbi:MAG: urease subunit gamma [Thermoleophilia bacterium]
MLLQPREIDRLLLFQAAELARARRARGLLLNAPEAIAIIADTACEAARDGAAHAEAIRAAMEALGPDDVLPGVPALVGHIEVEALFTDGTRLLLIVEPLGRGAADGPGSVLPAAVDEETIPGLIDVTVTSTAVVPIAITSHWHFFEANRLLDFDRAAAWGMRLAIPTGSTIRWAPGETHTVQLRPYGGNRIAYGFSGLVNGSLDAPGAREAALAVAADRGYLGADA